MFGCVSVAMTHSSAAMSRTLVLLLSTTLIAHGRALSRSVALSTTE